MKYLVIAFLCLAPPMTPACELCAIYSAASARGESSSGFIGTISQQYIPYETLQKEGNRYSAIPFLDAAFLDNSITHFVPGYNFSPSLGVSVNLPYIYRKYHLTEITYPQPVEQSGNLSGLGDASIVGRWTVFKKIKMDRSVVINILAGIKFPTGDTEQLEQEVAQERYLQSIFPNGHQHAFGGVHQHDLSLGSGSYDGVFGLTANFRWKRSFFNGQAQYYLRTEALDYEFGDLSIISGGPGVYALLLDNFTLSVQASAFYESLNRDTVLDQKNNQTGSTAWYMGPQISLTWGEHFSANAGADFPLRIYNRGIQSVPDYRVHAGVSWRF
ncbi:MAG TPA: hypothetical protein VFA77_18075 [Candidatus Eisenbacteria bacterium]|nr:hypothetical protein [Candidatus Eisenbacteria bacterium]